MVQITFSIAFNYVEVDMAGSLMSYLLKNAGQLIALVYSICWCACTLHTTMLMVHQCLHHTLGVEQGRELYSLVRAAIS